MIQSFSFTYRNTICALHLEDYYQSFFTHYRLYLLSFFFPSLVICPANNCLRIESMYHRAVRILLRKVSHRLGDLEGNLLGPLRRKISFSPIRHSFPTLISSSFFYIARSLNEKYKKLCTQVHFRCALMSTEYK